MLLSFIITAEFIIALAEKNDTFDTFKIVLAENGAEFSVSKLQTFGVLCKLLI
jgi:hypothetical protein